VAAVVAGVVLVHGLLLGHWAAPGVAPTPAAPSSPATAVRTIIATAPARPPTPTAEPPAVRPAPAAGPAGEAAPPRPAVIATLVRPPTPPAEAMPAAPPVAVTQPIGESAAVTPTVAPPASTAAAPASPPGSADAPPLYRAPLPPPFEAGFRLRRGALAGSANWRLAVDGGRYELTLQTRVLGREISHLRSEGQAGAWGLEPTRFVEGRRGRDQRAVNFQRQPGGGRISFSGPAGELPLPPGVQDRLGWLLQLAAIVDADPALRERGAEVSMWVVGPRGDADVWTFVVIGSEPAPDGTGAPALALRRDPRRAWDTEVRVWLDSAERHLPLRAAWRTRGPDAEAGGGVELTRESLVWR
jgi:hypothetical protein